jgi:hypothetical protein
MLHTVGFEKWKKSCPIHGNGVNLRASYYFFLLKLYKSVTQPTSPYSCDKELGCEGNHYQENSSKKGVASLKVCIRNAYIG